MYIIRFQFFSYVSGDEYPSLGHVLGLNAFIVALCVLISIYYPHIGDILRYCGAFTGLAYVFALPTLVHMKVLRAKQQLTWPTMLINSSIIMLGVLNLVSQFVIHSDNDVTPPLPHRC